MIYVIGDTQLKEGVRNPLVVIAHHICSIRPKHVVHLGDHWDMPSLSGYDKGKKSHEAKTYTKDIAAGNHSMREFWAIINKLWPSNKEDCTWVILEGNHEHRIDRAKDYGTHELRDLMEMVVRDYRGWEIVVPFLEIIRIHDIEFCHFFTNEHTSKPVGTARMMLNKRHVNQIAGHKQGFDYAEQLKGSDETIQAVILGSSYYHDEEYKKQSNHHFRGTMVVHLNGKRGFDFMRTSLNLLDKMYLKS